MAKTLEMLAFCKKCDGMMDKTFVKDGRYLKSTCHECNTVEYEYDDALRCEHCGFCYSIDEITIEHFTIHPLVMDDVDCDENEIHCELVCDTCHDRIFGLEPLPEDPGQIKVI